MARGPCQIPVQPPGTGTPPLPTPIDGEAVHMGFTIWRKYSPPISKPVRDRRNGLDHAGPRTALAAHLHHYLSRISGPRGIVVRFLSAGLWARISRYACRPSWLATAAAACQWSWHGDHSHGLSSYPPILDSMAQIRSPRGLCPASLAISRVTFGQSALNRHRTRTGYLAVPHLRKTLSQGIAARMSPITLIRMRFVGSGGPSADTTPGKSFLAITPQPPRHCAS